MLLVLRRKLYFILLIVISSLGLYALLPSKKDGPLSRQQRDAARLDGNDANVVNFEMAVGSEKFNISSEHLLVLLHIQKTGGTTFERHLVQDIRLNLPCSCNDAKRRCICPRKASSREQPESLSDLTWLISRFSTGWVCGLHPDFNQLKLCLAEAKKLYFLTFLRQPLHRFISEFRHVRRGATWKASKSHCHQHNTQLCYAPRPDWSNATLDEFLSCPNNMALNRQTRMLAEYNHSTSCNGSAMLGDDLLKSAMRNLDQLAYFGLCEQQRSSQLLFEKTFDLKFRNDFKQSQDNKTRLFIEELPQAVIDRILEANQLDVQLYDYAINLFSRRCAQLTSLRDCGATG